MVRSLHRFVLAAITGATLAAAVACGSAPESTESTESSGQEFSVRPMCALPRLWPYGYVSVNEQVCMAENEKAPGPYRHFENTAFENQLAADGCSYALANVPYPATTAPVRAFTSTTGDAGVETWSITVCPASCTINNLVASYVGAQNPDGTAVDPYLIDADPGTCIASISSGLVYVAWDPKCPGGCPFPIGP